MVAPPGPVSAEALKFTLLKPPAGPCTTTWVSTVSPRALDSLMEEAVPGASVCPTLVKLDSPQKGNAALDVWLAAMKSVKTTSSAAVNTKPLARRKVQRVCSPIGLTDLW